jgi:hypothetical protein
MDEADQLFSTLGLYDTIHRPAVLYHYTSMNALLSILSSGQIRATHIRYLNDVSEAKWMWKAVVERLEQLKGSAESETQSEQASAILKMVHERRTLDDFVASFSENGDDLSQWRAYCPGGAGFSIGFNTEALNTQWVADPKGGEPLFVGGSLKKVRYLGPDELKFSSDLDNMLRLLPPIFIERGFDGKPVSKEQFLMGWLSTISSSFKHYAFSAENEWRLILTKPHKPMPFQRFRPGSSSIIPYVEAVLNRNYKSEQPANYMINRVIIGPTPSPELSKEALEAAFHSAGHPEVDVEVSTIPFRHW